jgi:hypothetical protein
MFVIFSIQKETPLIYNLIGILLGLACGAIMYLGAVIWMKALKSA